MKATFLFLMIGFMQVSASLYSQSARLTLEMRDVKVMDVLEEIEKQSEFRFAYSSKYIDMERSVTVQLREKSIEETLQSLFRETAVVYVIDDRHILLYPKVLNVQQPRVITGTVTDQSGDPMIGVTITVKGTSQGTITDVTGKYVLEIPQGSQSLIFSFIGMETQEIAIGASAEINVVLAESTIDLDEVVVIGYGTRVRGAVTGSIAKVDNSVFESRPVVNALEALQGALPGVSVIRSSGRPGYENIGLQIRGLATIHGASPLILVDGIPGNINLINPSDISDVTVLKDAAAAIYGARAADGVILVTTKRGSKGVPRITYSGNYSNRQPTYLPKMVTTMQLAELYDMGLKNMGGQGLDPKVFEKIRNNAPPDYEYWFGDPGGEPAFYGNTDWHKLLWGNSSGHNHNLTISGGGENTDYLFSAGYNRVEGLANYGTNYTDRYNLRMNYDFNVSKRLRIETRNSYSNEYTVEPSAFAEPTENPTYRAKVIRGYQPLYNPQGQLYQYWLLRNPILMLQEYGEGNVLRSLFSTNLKADLTLTDDLKLVGQVGINVTDFADKYHFRNFRGTNWKGDPAFVFNNPNRAWQTNRKVIYKSYTSYLDFNKIFFEKHRINLMAGASHEDNDHQWVRAEGRNFANNELFTLNLADRSNIANVIINGGATDWALRSFFGRLGYSFGNKYFLDFTTRVDGSSKFPKSTRWSSVYPSAAISWNLTGEDFITALNTFDLLKLRVSWGQSGNQELSFGNYDYIPLINISSGYLFGTPAASLPAAVATLASESRTWETIETRNVGIDLSVLSSRLAFSFDYFLRFNNDMLVRDELPSLLGGTVPSLNIGKLKTRGWELSANWSDRAGDFRYSISAIISDSENTLIELKGSDQLAVGFVATREGYPINSYFGYKWDGYIQDQEELAEYKQLGNLPARLGIGDVKWKDLDGDGKITPFGDPAIGSTGDIEYLGNNNPRYLFSSNINLEYKRFGLSTYIQGVGKRYLIERDIFTTPMSNRRTNMYQYWYGKFWTPDNRNAPYPRFIPGGEGFNDIRDHNFYQSDMLLRDIGYLRFKTITFSYSLPDQILKLKKIRTYITLQDYFTFARFDFDGTYDPETGRGRDHYPFSKSVSIGLDVTF